MNWLIVFLKEKLQFISARCHLFCRKSLPVYHRHVTPQYHSDVTSFSKELSARGGGSGGRELL